jgi:peptidoglycan/xylan/chitin deacetylase (PgdA/CDA1 family)
VTLAAPPVRWPGGARCAVFVSVDLDGIALERGEGVEPLGINSCGVYAYRCGVPRYLRLFEQHGLLITFFVPGFDAEAAPDVIRAIAAQGHEIGAHGYCHEGAYLEGEEEWRLLRRTHEILAGVVGAPPVGWRNPGGMKSRFTAAYLRELGYVYDSSDKDFERPYRFQVGGQAPGPMVELPTNSAILDDGHLNPIAMLSPSEILALWRAEFDATYRAGGYFALILHGRAWWGMGTPSRTRVLDALIRYIRTHPNVAWVRGADLARWCLEDPAAETLDTHDRWLYRGSGP